MTEATSSEDSSSSRHEPIPITRDPRALFIGIAVSVVCLVVGEGWAISLHNRSWILGLSAQWVALAVLPLLIGLVVGGYIPKISFAGLTFESPGYIKGLPRVAQEPVQEPAPEPAPELALESARPHSARWQRILSWARPERQRTITPPRPPDWAKPPKRINEQGEFLTPVHSYKPSRRTGQKYDISIYLMRHIPGSGRDNQTTDFQDIDRAEFYFGRNWGHLVYDVKNDGKVIGINTRGNSGVNSRN